MVWYIIGGIAAVAAMGMLLFTYVRDRRYLKLPVSKAMSRELWGEIEQEREEALARRERFQQAVERAKQEEIGGGRP